MSRNGPNHLSGFDDVDISTESTSYHPHSPSPMHDFPPESTSSHQRTLTGTFLDLKNRATTTLKHHTSQASLSSLQSLHSPTKSLASFIPTRSPLESSASQPKIRALQSWFNGASAPVRLGFSTPTHQSSDSESESGSEYDSHSEDDDEEDEESEMEKNRRFSLLFARQPSPTRSNADSTRPAMASPTHARAPSLPNASSKFAWLLSTQKNAVTPNSNQQLAYHDPDDELLNLNISQSLFPHGPADPLNPSSFHDLLTNAEALLSRYQSSYRQMSAALGDARCEQSAQDDELDEADTRARHLKMQLETMAARANEQDAQMAKLMKDLAIERKARQEAEALAKRSAKAENQETTPRRRYRTSNSNMSIDSGFESECETDAASTFSKECLSPASTDQSSILENDTVDHHTKSEAISASPAPEHSRQDP